MAEQRGGKIGDEKDQKVGCGGETIDADGHVEELDRSGGGVLMADQRGGEVRSDGKDLKFGGGGDAIEEVKKLDSNGPDDFDDDGIKRRTRTTHVNRFRDFLGRFTFVDRYIRRKRPSARIHSGRGRRNRFGCWGGDVGFDGPVLCGVCAWDLVPGGGFDGGGGGGFDGDGGGGGLENDGRSYYFSVIPFDVHGDDNLRGGGGGGGGHRKGGEVEQTIGGEKSIGGDEGGGVKPLPWWKKCWPSLSRM